MNGPEAMAGFIPSRFNINGVAVPTREAKMTTPKSEAETTQERLGVPKKSILAANTMSTKKKPGIKETAAGEALHHERGGLNPHVPPGGLNERHEEGNGRKAG